MSLTFIDRRDAGRQLGRALAAHGFGGTDPPPIVLGLPRGGIPVAFEVAAALHAPLDAFVVRKLGVPSHEELAMGAIASGGVRVMVPETVQALGISPEAVLMVSERERRELERRERAYRGAKPFPDCRGRSVIVVDDGVATGASMLAAVRALRPRAPLRIVAAAPVMSRDAQAALERVADLVVAVVSPEPFYGVGAHYEDFSQTTDGEVRELLAEAARSVVPPGAGSAT